MSIKNLEKELKEAFDNQGKYFFWQKESKAFFFLRKRLRLYRTPYAMRWNITEYDKGEKATCGWDRREERLKRLVPIQYFVRDTIPAFFSKYSYRLGMLRIAIKDYFHPHNVIKIRSIGKGWADTDTLMEAFLIQALIDFVELEHVCLDDDEYSEHNTNNNHEVKRLYNFFKKDLPSLKVNLDSLLMNGASEQYLKEQDRIDDLVTEHLVALIKIRKYLWS